MVRAESKWNIFFFFFWLILCPILSLIFFSFPITARLSAEVGAAGIIVSNHGARQLDYVPATIMALEEVIYYLSCGNVNSHCFLLVLWISLVFSCVLKLFTWELDHYFQFKFHIPHGFWKIQLLIQFTCSETCRLSTLHKVDFLFS